MLIIMNIDAGRPEVDRVVGKIRELGYVPHEIPGERRVAIGITGNRSKLDPGVFLNLPGVAEAIAVSKPYKLVSREMKRDDTIVHVGDGEVGGHEITVIAGPCSVEGREQIIDMAWTLKDLGVKYLRGGAYKPRTSPYSFQGMKLQGLEYLAEAKSLTGLKIVTEVKDTTTLPDVAAVADILQVGARNMQNYSLLEALGSTPRPVLLKRGISATIEEFLMAAEYLLSGGNYNVILCERGIRTFEPSTRFTLDLNAVPIIKKQSHLPLIVDPSHGVGVWDAVPSMAMAALAAGADGLIIETHADPGSALSDGYQSLKPSTLRDLMERLRRISEVMDRGFCQAVSHREVS